ncbi:MAG: agmatine deiminase family protein, partial [Planctomycetes bacterium]|nr:agmatine deiminase family protein [Planctomycetota bacterium]
TILTTESCLLHPKRNPGLSHSQVDQLLAENFKATNILWLTCGEIVGDDTDGHIDQMARFVGPSTLVVSVEDDPNDVNYQPLLKMGQQLRTFSDQDGRPFDIISLPMPDPLFWQGQRLPASYANFYIANDAVVVPQFDDAADEVALGILNDLFLDREVLGFPSVDLVLGLGSIHCLTQQQPKSRESR